MIEQLNEIKKGIIDLKSVMLDNSFIMRKIKQMLKTYGLILLANSFLILLGLFFGFTFKSWIYIDTIIIIDNLYIGIYLLFFFKK